jgi:hypothetical protein
MKLKYPCTRRIVTGMLAIGASALVAQAAAPPSPQGVISGKAWTGISGQAVANLTGQAAFPDSPDVALYPPYFEWNATGDIATAPGNWGDNYGTQIVGYFYPPQTTSYFFAICADDNAELYLSTDDNPENKKLIARETVWSNPREYTTSSGGSDESAKLSDTFEASEWPDRDPFGGIVLQANQAYYIEALHKEGVGGDNLSVSVLGAGIDDTQPIPGQYLSSVTPNGPCTITTQPESQTVDEGQSVTFSVEVEGTPPYAYQWKKNDVNILDATASSYTINRAPRADNEPRPLWCRQHHRSCSLVSP